MDKETKTVEPFYWSLQKQRKNYLVTLLIDVTLLQSYIKTVYQLRMV